MPKDSNFIRWKKNPSQIKVTFERENRHNFIFCLIFLWQRMRNVNHGDTIMSLATLFHYTMQMRVQLYNLCRPWRYKNPSGMFQTFRPVMAIRKNDDITVIELMVRFEMNIEKSRNYKKNKYRALKSDLNINVKSYKFILIKITGFFCKQSKELKHLFKKHHTDVECYFTKMTEVAIR